MDLHGHITRYIEQRVAACAAATIEGERGILRGWAHHMGARPLRQIGGADIVRWLAEIRHLAPSTRRNRLRVVRAFCRWAIRHRLISRDPTADAPMPKVPRRPHRALTQEQAEAIVAECEDSRDRLIILLGLHIGLRRAEIAALHVEDLDMAASTVWVEGKGGHVRVLPMPGELVAAVDAYLRDWGVIHGPLVRGDKWPDRAVTPPWVGRRVTELARRAGVKRMPWDGVSAHALRHTAATHVARRTGSAMAVRDLLGHASLATSQVYVAEDPGRLAEAVEGRSYLVGRSPGLRAA